MKKTASIVGMSLALARGFTGRHVVKVGSRQSMMTRSRRVAAAMTSSSVALTPLPTFEITSTKSGAAAWEGNMLVLPLFSPAEEADGDKAADAGDRVADLPAAYQALDEASFDGALSELVTSESFKANAGETVCVRLASGSSVRTLCVLGLGPQPADSTKEVDSTKFGEALAAVAKDRKPDRMGVVVPDAPCDASKIVGGMMTALYSEDRFKTGDNVAKPLKLESLDFIDAPSEYAAEIEAAQKLAKGVYVCKDLVGAPPNVVTPKSLAELAVSIAEEHSDVFKAEVLELPEIEARNMGAYLGVAQGSKPGDGDPKFVHMWYSPPKGDTRKKVALVGKALTFDSGGYNLKAGAGSMIEMMKFDMGGSAAVLGAAKAIGLLKPEGVEVHFIAACCENMISDKAMRPGDILTASNGKTIEVINTDAEGRLTLADALVFAEALGVDQIVDMATLTGACLVGLGDEYAGLWSPDDDLLKALEDSSAATGDKIWRMPLAKEYMDQCKSPIADLKNVGGRAGGAITAALFLKEFVEKTPWAHIDIAGPVWNDKKGGATGFGVRLLVDFCTKAGLKK